MELLNPSALWLLGLLAILLLLPRLRRPRVRRVVANSYMWRQVEYPGAPRFFVKFRRSPYLLQAAVMLLLIAAVARPLMHGAAHDVVFVVDLSASMGAKANGRTRLDIARDEILTLTRELPRWSRVRIVAARTAAADLGEFGARSAGLRELLRALRPGAGTSTIESAVNTARELAGPAAEIRVFTDQPARDKSVLWTRVGSPADNLAVTALAARRLPGSSFDAQLLAEVRNFGASHRDVSVAIRRGEELLFRDGVALDPRGTRTLVHNVSNPSGIYSATIEADDALDVDNRRYAMAGATAGIPVSLTTPANFFLERALEANPAVELRMAQQAQASLRAAVVVCDGCREIPGGTSGVLVIPPAERTTVSRALRVTSADHPVMAGVDLADVTAPVSTGIETPADATVLARAGDAPAILAFVRDGRRVVVVRIDLERTALASEIAFPVLVANAVAWLAAQDLVPTVLEAGEPVRWNASRDRQTITTPDGRTIDIMPTGTSATFADTEMPGIYSVGPTDPFTFVANPATASESDLSALAPPDSAGPEPSARVTATERRVDLFTTLVVAGLLLVALEWWWYCRLSAWT